MDCSGVPLHEANVESHVLDQLFVQPACVEIKPAHEGDLPRQCCLLSLLAALVALHGELAERATQTNFVLC